MIDKKWIAELKMYTRMFSSICNGKKIICKEITSGSEIGYTSNDNRIYLAKEHPIMDSLTVAEKCIFRMGVFAHETLHQCLTSFEYNNKMLEICEPSEREIQMTFVNTLEDPAIEYFAPNVMGGDLLDALRFTIMHIYKESNPIQESKTAFSQLINALIQFGDRGLVKGKFTFPEAEKYFRQLAPLYNKGIVCSDPKERIDIAIKCKELSRPLWEKELEDETLREMLANDLGQILGNNIPQSSVYDSPMEFDDSGESEETISSKTREKVVSKLSEANEEKTSETDDTTSVKNATKDTESSKTNGASASVSRENNTETSRTDDVTSKDNSSKSTDENSSDISGESMSDHDASDMVQPYYTDTGEVEETGNSEHTDEWYSIDDELFQRIIESIENETKNYDMSNVSDQHSEINWAVNAPKTASYSCLNRYINSSSNFLPYYNEIVRQNAKEITNVTKNLKRIISNSYSENIRYTSGRYNIKRGAAGTSAKIFDKKKEKKECDDLAIELLVDLSGSMIGDSKINEARRTAIVLTEVFHNLNIPCKVIGFTADMEGYDTVHYHYTDWKYNKTQSASLIAMDANGNNRDGYSIRYAEEILKHVHAERKILFIISDGQPYAKRYKGASAITDTANAIRNAKKNMIVFGIALGNCEAEILQIFYGKDFIHVIDPKTLTNTLAKKLEKLIV